jgi:hypothetical protein
MSVDTETPVAQASPAPPAPPVSPVATATHDARGPVSVLFGLTFMQLLLVLGWPVVVAGLFFVLVGASKQDVREVVDGVKVRPPVKVIFVTDHVSRLISRGMSTDDALLQMQKEVEGLRKAGYIVLDGSSVMAAPEAVEVR